MEKILLEPQHFLLLRDGWEEAAKGMNRTIPAYNAVVYGLADTACKCVQAGYRSAAIRLLREFVPESYRVGMGLDF